MKSVLVLYLVIVVWQFSLYCWISVGGGGGGGGGGVEEVKEVGLHLHCQLVPMSSPWGAWVAVQGAVGVWRDSGATPGLLP